MTYIGLDTTQHERSGPPSSTPLPAGLYTGVITRTQLKETKKQDGHYLEVEFDITSPGEYSNRKFWDRFNIANKSVEATRIGKEQLSDLAKATGLQMLSEDTDLHGKEVTLILRVRPAKDGFEANNECDKYWPVGTTLQQHEEWRSSKGRGSTAKPAAKQNWGSPAQAAPATATPVASASGGPKPWQKK